MRSDPVTLAALNAALPHVLAAPRTDASVTGLCLRPARGERAFPDRIVMTRAQAIPGERWLTEPWMRLPDGTPHPGIQISILQQRVLDLVWPPDDGVVHPGDPIVADLDCTVENLPEGALIEAGTALLRVSEVANFACAKWKVRYGADAYDWVRDPAHARLRLRGVLCAVERDGQLALGERLKVVARPGNV